MDKWKELRKRLKEVIAKEYKMSYYEYMYSQHFGAKEALALMDKVEMELWKVNQNGIQRGNDKMTNMSMDELEQKGLALMGYLNSNDDNFYKYYIRYDSQRMETIISLFKLYWMGSRDLEWLMQQMGIHDYKFFVEKFGVFLNEKDLKDELSE